MGCLSVGHLRGSDLKNIHIFLNICLDIVHDGVEFSHDGNEPFFSFSLFFLFVYYFMHLCNGFVDYYVCLTLTEPGLP